MTKCEPYICKLPEKEREFAAVHLNENEEDRSQKIEEIRQWILESSDLHARTDDFSILRFLRACKFNIPKTKQKLRNFYEQRKNIPEWFANKDPFLPEVQEVLNLGTFLPLRKLNNEGQMVIIIRTAVHNPEKHKLADVLKASLMILDFATKDHELVSLHGVTVILDLEGVSLGHAMQLTPKVIKKLVHAWQGCYPLRIRSMDFINAPIYVNVVLNLFRKVMYEKLKRKLHVHMRNSSSFSEKAQLDILPVEYGGTDDSVAELKDYWQRVIEENRTWLIDDEQYKVIST